MLRKVTHCAGRVSANTRPHQLRWGDREMGTAISCTKCSQVAGLIQKLVETPRSSKVPSLRPAVLQRLYTIATQDIRTKGSCTKNSWTKRRYSVSHYKTGFLIFGHLVDYLQNHACYKHTQYIKMITVLY